MMSHAELKESLRQHLLEVRPDGADYKAFNVILRLQVKRCKSSPVTRRERLQKLETSRDVNLAELLRLYDIIGRDTQRIDLLTTQVERDDAYLAALAEDEEKAVEVALAEERASDLRAAKRQCVERARCLRNGEELEEEDAEEEDAEEAGVEEAEEVPGDEAAIEAAEVPVEAPALEPMPAPVAPAPMVVAAPAPVVVAAPVVAAPAPFAFTPEMAAAFWTVMREYAPTGFMQEVQEGQSRMPSPPRLDTSSDSPIEGSIERLRVDDVRRLDQPVQSV